jgi:2,3-dihydroxybenzoate decarboxylase
MLDKIALEEHYEFVDPQLPVPNDFMKKDFYEYVQARLRNIDLRIEDMDRNGIDTYILSLTMPGIEAILDAKTAVDTAKRVNDYSAEKLAGKYPARLRSFASLPLQNPAEAARELERAVKELGLVGALINGYSNIGDVNTAQYLDEPQVEVFWAKAEELGVPIYLHPRNPLPNQQRIYQGYGELMGSPWAFGIETATHAVRLILSGLFDRHPGLTIILGHLGEGLPFLLPRFEHRLTTRESTPGGHKRPPTEYLQKNFYLTTSGTLRTSTLLDTILEVGVDRVLFSVDSPYEKEDELASWFDNCPISDNDRRKIGRDNAKALFKL